MTKAYENLEQSMFGLELGVEQFARQTEMLTHEILSLTIDIRECQMQYESD